MSSTTGEPAVPAAQPPEEAPGAVRVASPPGAAAGLRAVAKALTWAVREVGVVKGPAALLKLNQVDGIDCQSCAWPTPDAARSMFEFCENGAKALADEATRRRADRAFFARYTVAEMAARSDHWINAQGRLVEPMVLEPGATHYVPIPWEDALRLVARELRSLPTPDAAAFYTSGRASNEAAFLYQLLVRCLGTNNLPDCSDLCHESSGAALAEVVGSGKGTVTLADFDEADAVLVIGQNPGTNHPRMLTTLAAAKRRGAKVVVMNPLREVGLVRFRNPQDFLSPLRMPGALLGRSDAIADFHLQVRVGGDLAALKGLMKWLAEWEAERPGQVFDREFLRAYTTGLEAFLEDLRQTTWEAVEAASGLTRAGLKEAAEVVAGARRMIVCWAMGLTQHRHSVATIRQVAALALLGGHIGRPGAGLCPVRGHSNVQGDRTMGIVERPSKAFLERLERHFGLPLLPRAAGLDTVATIEALAEGRVRVLVALGGNFLSASPDTEVTAAAVRQAALTVHVATKPNRSHLVTGRRALLLPCLGRSEADRTASGVQFVTTEDGTGTINRSQGHLEPAGPALRSEVAIVCGLGRALFGDDHHVPWGLFAEDNDRVRDAIAACVPGFEDFNRRIRHGVIHLPHPVRDRREFPTASGRAEFRVAPIPPDPLEPGQLLLMTLRSHDQFNTTVYGLDDRYRGVYGGRRVVFLNPEDLAERGLQGGQFVDVTSHWRGRTRVARGFLAAPYDLPRRCAAAYFPEANVLVPIDSLAEGSRTPTSKGVPVTVEPARAPGEALEQWRGAAAG